MFFLGEVENINIIKIGHKIDLLEKMAKKIPPKMVVNTFFGRGGRS